MWRFATEGDELAELIATEPAGTCPLPDYGIPTKELGALWETCRAALEARDRQLAAWRRWVDIERAAQEKLGHGIQIND